MPDSITLQSAKRGWLGREREEGEDKICDCADKASHKSPHLKKAVNFVEAKKGINGSLMFVAQN